MGDMGDVFRGMQAADKERRHRNQASADPDGWTQHTEWHWSRMVAGHKMQYWPSKNKFHYRGKTYHGGVDGFIRNKEKENEQNR